MASPETAPQKARRLLGDNKQAAGGVAWDGVRALYLRSAIRQGGLNGTLEHWQDVVKGHYAQAHRLGITAGGEGFDGTLPWSQDVSGHPRPEENGDAEEAAANTAYRACLAWWYPQRWGAKTEYVGQAQDGDRPCHVLRLTPDGGRPFDLWLDAATGLAARTVEQGAFETVVRSFSDYRAVGGLRLPFRVRTSNGHTRYDQECQVERVEVNPPGSEAHLRMPPPPPPDFQITGDQDSVEVPFRQVGNLIVVGVSVNGRKVLPFILDTGGVNLVTPEAAQELGLEPQGAFWGFGGGEGAVDMRAAAVSSLEFGGVRLSNQVVWVYPFPGLKEALGLAELGGLLGYEVFRRLVVRVDYQHQRLTLTRPDRFSYGGGGTVVSFRFHGNIPEVEGALDGMAGRFDLDTGNTGALILNAPFVERHELAARYGATELKTGEGAGGGIVSFLVGQGACLRLGGVEVADLPVALSLHRSGALSNPYAAGLVGAEVFRRFTMIFDYSRQQVVFEERGLPR
jgi:hypothetical protein